MANKRIFQVRGLTTNGVAVGGLATMGINITGNPLASTPDVAAGAEYVDVLSRSVAASLTCSDVSKAGAILDAVPAATTFSAKNSFDANFSTYTIGGVGAGIAWAGMNLNFPSDGEATLNLNGPVGFNASAFDTLAELIALDGAVIPPGPTRTVPTRFFRPNTVTFDQLPKGVGGTTVTIEGVKNIALALTAQTIQDNADLEEGFVVERLAWSVLDVTVTFMDATEGTNVDKGQTIMALGAGALIAPLKGFVAAGQLDVNNVKFFGLNANHTAEFTTYDLVGQASWIDSEATPQTLTMTGGTKDTNLFHIA